MGKFPLNFLSNVLVFHILIYFKVHIKQFTQFFSCKHTYCSWLLSVAIKESSWNINRTFPRLNSVESELRDI